MGRIKNLSELNLDGAQNFVLIQARADRLSDFRQQFVFLGAPMRVVADHVVLERQPQLQTLIPP